MIYLKKRLEIPLPRMGLFVGLFQVGYIEFHVVLQRFQRFMARETPSRGRYSLLPGSFR